MGVHETSKPAIIKLAIARTHNRNIHHSNGRLRVAGKDAGAAKRVGHPSDENIAVLEERAAQLIGFRLGHESV